MCAQCDAVTLRADASVALLDKCLRALGDELRSRYPVDYETPPDIAALLKKLS